MNTMAAFAMGEMSRNNPSRVFDWDKAAQLIRERRPECAGAGLGGDWEWTGGSIYRDGKPVPKGETYTYLASTWATPELDMDGDVIPCWRMESDSPGWGPDTYWPDSAVAILHGEASPPPSPGEREGAK